jgi:hypothetical protein
VQAYPGPGGKWRISTSGGDDPKWRADGRELYYLSSTRKMMAVTVERGAAGTAPRFSLPRELFTAPVSPETTIRNRYDVTRDGQRFLVVAIEDAVTVSPTTVVLDWLGRQAGR